MMGDAHCSVRVWRSLNFEASRSGPDIGGKGSTLANFEHPVIPSSQCLCRSLVRRRLPSSSSGGTRANTTCQVIGDACASGNSAVANACNENADADNSGTQQDEEDSADEEVRQAMTPKGLPLPTESHSPVWRLPGDALSADLQTGASPFRETCDGAKVGVAASQVGSGGRNGTTGRGGGQRLFVLRTRAMAVQLAKYLAELRYSGRRRRQRWRHRGVDDSCSNSGKLTCPGLHGVTPTPSSPPSTAASPSFQRRRPCSASWLPARPQSTPAASFVRATSGAWSAVPPSPLPESVPGSVPCASETADAGSGSNPPPTPASPLPSWRSTSRGCVGHSVIPPQSPWPPFKEPMHSASSTHLRPHSTPPAAPNARGATDQAPPSTPSSSHKPELRRKQASPSPTVVAAAWRMYSKRHGGGNDGVTSAATSRGPDFESDSGAAGNEPAATESHRSAAIPRSGAKGVSSTKRKRFVGTAAEGPFSGATPSPATQTPLTTMSARFSAQSLLRLGRAAAEQAVTRELQCISLSPDPAQRRRLLKDLQRAVHPDKWPIDSQEEATALFQVLQCHRDAALAGRSVRP
eukprot:TRINITY_DN6625_c0_g5_i2.p1 TRINITY_DN6625_c0_g5~~TRINITY_DN6625_c0_g5_i2.p1  ORF type:complete len:578 (-),score=95.37 TRINITY_DN6625_c0_g5_i2:60-1793(-)